ncbi:MAG: hypothetical protein JSS81_11510 [Acidobacteria bacterium]|nr:hypothetical protein [Acidobacteriota bacterium]
MGQRKILTIKGWLGTGTADLRLEILGYYFIERRFPSYVIRKFIVNRRPDRYSSRLGMMANLNKSKGALAWGFASMSFSVETTDDDGAFVSSRIFDLTGIGTENVRMSGDEEEITFVYAEMSEFMISNLKVWFD